MHENIENEIIEIFEENGFNIDRNINDDYREYNFFTEIDSLQFISIISDIENKYGIEIPEQYLIPDNINNLYNFINIITNELSSCTS